MARVLDTRRWVTAGTTRDSRRTALATTLALIAAVMLLALPGIHSLWVYSVASSVAFVGALALIVAGERAWEHLLDSARAAGVVAP